MVDVAQSVERRSVAAEAAGSKPVIHPIKRHWLFASVFCYAQISRKDSPSRVTLGTIFIPGAEFLNGKGDAIVSHHHDGGLTNRIQTPYIKDDLLRKILHK